MAHRIGLWLTVVAFAVVAVACSTAGTDTTDAASEQPTAAEEGVAPNASMVTIDVGVGPVPAEVVELIDQWKQSRDESIVDLYTMSGAHLYGAARYMGEDIAAHLTSPRALAIDHEPLTPLLLVAAQDGRWVVTQGMANISAGSKYRSSISWEVVEDADGDLKLAQSAWFKVTS